MLVLNKNMNNRLGYVFLCILSVGYVAYGLYYLIDEWETLGVIDIISKIVLYAYLLGGSGYILYKIKKRKGHF